MQCCVYWEAFLGAALSHCPLITLVCHCLCAPLPCWEDRDWELSTDLLNELVNG